jgi:hypothetical protein
VNRPGLVPVDACRAVVQMPLNLIGYEVGDKHLGKVAAGSEFVARRVRAANGFKGGDFVTHGFRFSAFGIRHS